jgi:hypothetical protein
VDCESSDGSAALDAEFGAPVWTVAAGAKNNPLISGDAVEDCRLNGDAAWAVNSGFVKQAG